MTYRTLNPTTEELIETFPDATEEAIESALEAGARAFSEWRRSGFEHRAGLLIEVADELERRADVLARLMALEMGKPLEQGKAEAIKCSIGCRYFAEHAPAFLRSELRDSDAAESFVAHEPLGPILAIMPWNFPFWQFFRFAAPALMAGNTVLLKHAPSTPRCALAIVDVMRAAGCPAPVVQSLFLTNEQAERVIGDSRLRGVTLTGSTRAGSEVAATAGRHLKRMVMELGGSDPFIVFEDSDLEEAARIGVAARCQNSGQSCIAAKRFLVQQAVFEQFSAHFVDVMQAQTLGDPTEPGVEIGPLARADLRDRLAEQVRQSQAAGAVALCGGSAPPTRGYFYPPTVLDRVAPGSPAATEELFGPVAALIPFEDESDAARLANATLYGLGASIWTRDADRARRLSTRLEAGNVFVNGLVKSDPALPFGGVKDSGFGRELSREGTLEFVNVKTVWIR
jgi:succinate-semialdehyde dehydrogenase/glutarate-semialdehyde dehydrogenase